MKAKNILLLLALFVLVSCQFQPKQPQSVLTEADIRQGIDALVMNFVNGAPPPKVFESRPQDTQDGLFDVSATLQNKGAANITGGYLVVSYEDAYVSAASGESWKMNDEYTSSNDNTMQFDLAGRSLDNPSGDVATVSKKLKTKMLEQQSQIHTSTILLTACYNYQTYATANVCVDPDPTSQKAKPCTVQDISLTNQGAPMAVTKVEVSMLTRGKNQVTPTFIIHVANVGNGRPFNSNLTQLACGGTLSEEQKSNLWDIVDINATLGNIINPHQFNCAPLPFRLESNMDYVRCVYDGTITATDAYTTPLNIALNYGYTQTISTSIEIDKNPSLHVGG